MLKQQIQIGKDFGWFIGDFDNNKQHKHYAIQISIPIKSSVTIQFNEGEITTKSPIIIKPNSLHRIVSESTHFLLLVNPASSLGHYWNQLTKKQVEINPNNPATELQHILEINNLNSNELREKLNEYISSKDCFCGSTFHADNRIRKALDFLDQNNERIVSLEEIANHCNLSQSRFIHLFKEETGITYRRAQLWIKVLNALQLLQKESLTQIAYKTGFADSSHFSRVFKENFGFSPRDFLKLSQFIQV